MKIKKKKINDTDNGRYWCIQGKIISGILLMMILISSNMGNPSKSFKTDYNYTVQNSSLFDEELILVNTANDTEFEINSEVLLQFKLWNLSNLSYIITINDRLAGFGEIEEFYSVSHINFTHDSYLEGVNFVDLILYERNHITEDDYVLGKISLHISIVDNNLSIFELLILICVILFLIFYFIINIFLKKKIQKEFNSILSENSNEPLFFDYKKDLIFFSKTQLSSVQKSFKRILLRFDIEPDDFAGDEFLSFIKTKKFKFR